MLGAAEAHAHQVALLGWGFSIDKALAPMQDGQVVDKMHVSSLRLDLHLGGLCDGLDGIERLDLAIGQRGQVARARVCLISNESRPAKVHDELAVLEKEDGLALKLGPGKLHVSPVWNRYPAVRRPPLLKHLHGKRPIGTRQCPNQVRTRGCQNVVDRIG